MSYFDLIEVGLNVDTSGLQEKLGEIDQKLEALSEGTVESEVSRMVDDYLDDKLQDRVDTAINDADLDSVISQYLGNNGYIDEDEVQSKIDDALQDYVTAQDVRDIVTDESPEMTEDAVQDMIQQALESDEAVKDLERRLDVYSQKVDDLRGKVVALEAQMANVQATSQDATTLLGLLRRAAEIILGR